MVRSYKTKAMCTLCERLHMMDDDHLQLTIESDPEQERHRDHLLLAIESDPEQERHRHHLQLAIESDPEQERHRDHMQLAIESDPKQGRHRDHLQLAIESDPKQGKHRLSRNILKYAAKVNNNEVIVIDDVNEVDDLEHDDENIVDDDEKDENVGDESYEYENEVKKFRDNDAIPGYDSEESDTEVNKPDPKHRFHRVYDDMQKWWVKDSECYDPGNNPQFASFIRGSVVIVF